MKRSKSNEVWNSANSLSKGLFTWGWGTPGRWGNPLWWGKRLISYPDLTLFFFCFGPGRSGYELSKPPVHIISHLIWSHLHDRRGDRPHVTSPIWGPPPPCKQALSDVFAAVAVVVAYKLPIAWNRLVPARRLPRPSRSMLAETNSLRPCDSKRIGRAESLGLGIHVIMI